MKITINEYDGCTSIDMEAETVEEAAQLMRLKMNSKKEIRSIGCSAHLNGEILGYVTIGKRKDSNSFLR